MSSINLPGNRKVGHLTLHRQPREISAQEFNALSPSERLEMVRSVPGRAKYDLLIEAHDVESLVQQLSAQEVYVLIREIGQDDVTDLVEMVSPEQLTTFIDLDAWSGETYDANKALKWLTLLAESEEDHLWRSLGQLDVVSLSLLLSRFITVTGGLGDLLEEDRLQQGDIDRIYQVEYKDSEVAKLVGKVLDTIYRRDRDIYLNLLETVRTESGSELEEVALQQRNGRLMDQGIPDPESARVVFAYLDPERFEELASEPKASLYRNVVAPVPGNLLVTVRPGQILEELFSEGLNENLAWELACLVNKVLVASRYDIGDAEQVAQGISETYASLEIALGYLSGLDLQRAQQYLDAHYLEHLFRLGHSLLRTLQQKARTLMDEVGALLDPPYLRFVEGLAAQRPVLYRGIRETQRDDTKPFASYEDVLQATEVLGEVVIQQKLFVEHLGVNVNALDSFPLDGCNVSIEDITFSTLLLTAMANRVLGKDFSPTPLAAEDLKRLHARVSINGKLNEDLRAEAREWIEELTPGGSSYADYCLHMLEEGFCALEDSALDARYVAGLIVKL